MARSLKRQPPLPLPNQRRRRPRRQNRLHPRLPQLSLNQRPKLPPLPLLMNLTANAPPQR